jgi:hypothetical protein
MQNDAQVIKEALENQTRAIEDNTAALLMVAMQVITAAGAHVTGEVSKEVQENVRELFDDLKERVRY